MQFLRATQTNGRFDPHSDGRSLPLSPEAFAFWQEHGAVIANLLRPETPLPLSAVVVAYAEYQLEHPEGCLLYTSPSPRDRTRSRMPSSA